MLETTTLTVSFDLAPTLAVTTTGSIQSTRFYLFERTTKEELGQFDIPVMLPHCGYIAKVEKSGRYVTEVQLFEVVEEAQHIVAVRPLRSFTGNVITLLEKEMRSDWGKPLLPMLTKLHLICTC